ncbi:polysaccharide export protein [Neisseria perflava]|uniref:polysaccharide export protein n=1 Tax=Neisseria perflava TaxID=33053 RepID=UPI0020A0296C|nr:polysaccharide export protein [Neisseria perflava]MCP1659202.1 polysaccharide export outer membrane protein [Neisseria perflava]MCP1771756.1 polysaccharide export outer membrane protein [Neisseria perflava]
MKKLIVISLSLLVFISGCSSTTIIPGSNISTRNKTIVYGENESKADTNLDSRVAVYPITLGLIERMREPEVTAQHNPILAQRRANYQYRIGNGDVLNIMVWAHNDLNSPVQQSNPQTHQVSRGTWVDERGYIAYPLIGQMYAKGKTIAELQNAMTTRLRQYLKNPQVSINVTDFRSQRVSIAGAVAQAGELPITNVPMTILDAVNLAGGAASNADTQHIKWTHNGVDRTISLQKILQYGDMSQNHLLSDGDIVYIPNNSNSKVYVMGEVGQQTTLPIGNLGLNLTQALGNAGGMNQSYSDATGVFVVRRAPEDLEKPIHIYQLNLKDATAFALGNEFKLKSDDVVYVTAAPVARWGRVISHLTNTVTNVNSVDDTLGG